MLLCLIRQKSVHEISQQCPNNRRLANLVHSWRRVVHPRKWWQPGWLFVVFDYTSHFWQKALSLLVDSLVIKEIEKSKIISCSRDVVRTKWFGCNRNVQALIAETVHGVPPKEFRQSMPEHPAAMVVDSKGFFDAVTRSCGSHALSVERRLQIDLFDCQGNLRKSKHTCVLR